MAAIRTLVVDDDFMVAEVHRGFVERVGGFEVVGMAHSGAEALRTIARLAPELLILDVYLPDRSGLSVLQELRQHRVAIDVIVVTAARDVASLQEAMQGGVLHYIVKPFDFARFERTLQSYRRFREERAAREVLAQSDVDRLYSLMAGVPSSELPKGLNRPTLDLVVRYLLREQAARGAQQVAEGTGISRATARRYLEYLESRGQATLELRYGSTGRPEHLYRAGPPRA
jgi:two-component system CitB family response regulator